MTVSTVATEREISREAAAFARWVGVLEPAMMLAERIVGTAFVPAAIRNDAPAILACIMYGDEIGIGPMQSLAGIHVIDGRPAPSSELLRAMIYAAGHSIRVIALTGESCTIAGRRRGESDWTQIVWTKEMARNAGLYSKRGTAWNSYPRAMLLARASSELARIVFPDIVKGLGHVADDDATAEEFNDWAAQIAEPAPAPAPTTRTIERRRRESAVPAAVGASTGAVASAGASRPSAAPTGAPADHIPPPEAIPAPDATPAVRRVTDTPLPGDDGGGPLPDGDDADPDGQVNRTQIRAIMAGFNDINCDNRTLRLEITRAVIGRRVDTSIQLTRREALQLIGALSDLKVGARTLHIDPDGSVEIVANESE